MNLDISHLLSEWEFRPGEIQVRRFEGEDGIERIQLRLDLGLLQMNVSGRPDGKRPHGQRSAYAYYQSRLRRYRKSHQDSDADFVLKDEECAELQMEAMQYHHRSFCLFQLEDYEGVIQDAERNLAVCDFVQRYAAGKETVWSCQQFRPQLLMMRTRAKGALALKANRFEEAIALVEAGVEEIRMNNKELSQQDGPEPTDEIQSLEGWLEVLRAQRPLSERERLERALGEAVRREDYEQAAVFRDALRSLKSAGS
ncbi:MAG: UvrB/UvrC motif-containing protein [Candidatus Omnitrophica bacterium]|nr:UvrB/UvrC motif-containing protein [Candidatus Omnitrophota bacterium]